MYNLLTTSEAGAWNDALNRISPERRDIYFTPQYYRLYENLGDGEACCFVYDDGRDTALYPFLKNEVNALGYHLPEKYYDIQGAYGYNGVLTDNVSAPFARGFYEALASYCRSNNIIAEFTRFHPLLANHQFNDDYFTLVHDRQSVYFDLSADPSVLFESFQHSTKRQINRATRRFGIEPVISQGGEAFAGDVYDIYSSTMDRVDAVQQLYFNTAFFSEMLAMPGTVLFRAMLEGRLIAFIIGFPGGSYFHGHLSGSLKEFIHMSPNSLLYWHLINYAHDNGFRYLHIGGGDTPDPDNSLLKFKMNFSKLTCPFMIGKRIHNKSVYDEVVRQWEAREPHEFVTGQERILLRYRNKSEAK